VESDSRTVPLTDPTAASVVALYGAPPRSIEPAAESSIFGTVLARDAPPRLSGDDSLLQPPSEASASRTAVQR
jgi:hypothetical protein